jgi:2',3'-cyclic-nucleotide 2'-phosphodiesterase/3'-nucleotidase
MRISAASAVFVVCLVSLLTACDRAAPAITEQAPTTVPANVATLPSVSSTPALIPVPTLAATATARPLATTIASAATPGGGVPVPAQSFKYTVQAGDTLASIAARFNTTVDVVRALNNLQGDQITAGQVLTIPGSPPVAENPTPVPPPPPTATATKAPVVQPPSGGNPQPSRRVTYRVRAGDNLFRIGLRFGVPWQTIARYNGISDPTELSIGRVLIIPLGN